jgi:hypothetical protein
MITLYLRHPDTGKSFGRVVDPEYIPQPGQRVRVPDNKGEHATFKILDEAMVTYWVGGADLSFDVEAEI